ncbi:Rne/Rng family ribonuclease [Nesterenkonia aerolata]|uniref:Rne/Rng family ribonuclease n=1 Tax=Nesterenkonia aerolata TaxID=3074079 RepID=A0ABU2DQE3_9MICC|nr:Rne/Rng family ribonuclease [Nesterenkonia sp. LY-0111]MDR8018723.1 Rne/Rng family ribonuclease [Nesterenkonia sp. LY-0111]
MTQNDQTPTSESNSAEAENPGAETVADPFNVLFQAPDLSEVEPVRVSRPEAGAEADTGADTEDSDDSGDTSGAGDSSEDSSDSSEGGRRSRRKRRRGGGRNRGRGQGDQQDRQDEQDESDTPGSADDSNSESGDSAAKQDREKKQSSNGRSTKNKGGNTQDTSQDSQQDRRGERSENDSQDGEGHDTDEAEASENGSGAEDEQVVRKRRRRRRGSVDLEVSGGEDDDPEHTVTRVRAPRDNAESSAPTKVTGVKGSTRLEAKRQRRRASRSGGRRRQVITEAEFLARRESVDRKMIVRQRGRRVQIGVLEDGVLAEHYVSDTQQESLIGNVYLGKVQNVLPSMEAAFVDIGRGRNAVLYAGEVDWDAANLDGAPRKIENALKSGDSVLVQVTKDPVGHKGARLTSQVSLPGRYLVFVPGGSMTGISRKLPDTERARLKKVLKENMPENAGVIVRTAAEGASEQELTNDINRLRSLWESILAKRDDRKVLAPELLYSEPDLTIKVVRDVFNEDFSSMEVEGEETWDSVEAYVTYVAPHLLDRLSRWDVADDDGNLPSHDVFAHHRIDEQLSKALERKVNLPSGGSLVFDRTEAMTVVDVNTGKFTGSGGNLEETVTKNNLEAAEEIVRQLRLRDIGGIIVIDFIDMVLESNRDLVLRRVVECLGRDRTKHQVAEVTSLGLVQMTRKRMGTGLVEAFSEDCEHCAGRGLITHSEPLSSSQPSASPGESRPGRGKKRRKGRNRGGQNGQQDNSAQDGQNSRNGEDTELTAEQRREEQEKAEKAEKARQAMSQVAAASSNGSEDKSQAADGQKAPATLTIGGEEVTVPSSGQQGSESAQRTAEKSPEKSSVTLDSLDAAVASRSAEPARGRRRRRAASSAQGSGAPVNTVETSAEQQEESVATFTASFSAGSSGADSLAEEPAQKNTAAEPVMFGVGVSADQIVQGDGGSHEG